MQILGAEKALFRALKTKHDTPKYGLIYHASLVGQSNAKNKGKVGKMILFSGGGGVFYLLFKLCVGVRLTTLYFKDAVQIYMHLRV